MGDRVADYQVYEARADAARARVLAAATSPFTIEVRFVGGLTPAQQAAFASAADRWTTMIVGDLPSVEVDNEIIDDVLILAQGKDIDGTGRILGQAGPTHLRPLAAGATALLPAKGIMSFDSADLETMETDGTLLDVITHEMGHVLGIGTVWKDKKLVVGLTTQNPTFSGAAAMREYAVLRGGGSLRPVPVEDTGGSGTFGGHWRESVFRNELMSGFITEPDNPLSRMTVASLGDLGYDVDLDAAEPYELPDVLELAEAGPSVVADGRSNAGRVLPVIPIQLTAASLR